MAGTPEQWIAMYKSKWDDAEARLEEETRKHKVSQTVAEELKTEIRTVKDDFSKLEKHAKNCEKATNKAQKEAKDARGAADHRINSQKGQLKNAERMWDQSARELKVWKDRYESVDRPAEEKHALQASVVEWQSKAEQARNEIAVLEAQIEGTPEQIGLHQALEQWEEHQGCSKEFMEIEDKLQDSQKRQHKLESDLSASKQQHQKAKANMKALQAKITQLSQATPDQDKTNYLQRILQLESDLRSSIDQNQNTEKDLKEAQEMANQLAQEIEILQNQEKTDVDMMDDDMLDKAKLVSDLKASNERYQRTESDMNALKANADQLEQANKAFQDHDKTRNDLLQKLELDLSTAEAKHQTTKSDMEVLQGRANQLESELGITKEEYQNAKSLMEALQSKANRLEKDLEAASGKNKKMEEDIEILEMEKENLETDLGLANMDLGDARRQHHIAKLLSDHFEDMTKGLQESNQIYQKQEMNRKYCEACQKEGQDETGDNEMANAKEKDAQLFKQQDGASKLEQDTKTQQLRIESAKETRGSQVSSSAHIKGIFLFLSSLARNPLC